MGERCSRTVKAWYSGPFSGSFYVEILRNSIGIYIIDSGKYVNRSNYIC